MSRVLLLATDLDRTLLPNGPEPEPPGARDHFAALVARPDVHLAYVSGRDIGRIRQAIEEWSLPVPDVAIADVGTSVWHGVDWSRDGRWDEAIGGAWGSDGASRILDALDGITGLSPQAADRQGPWKASFARPPRDGDRERVEAALAPLGLPLRTIWSVDHVADEELLDVLPEAASKLHALEWLYTGMSLPPTDVVFAGDSGNDLEVLGSALPSVLVGNARPAIEQAAQWAAAKHPGSLYLASAYYAAGILEGVRFFRPELGVPAN